MEKVTEVMKENEMEPTDIKTRPWWSVRVPWLALLVVLVFVLITLLARPDLLDRGFKLAGL